jgi:hypothetical protein
MRSRFYRKLPQLRGLSLRVNCTERCGVGFTGSYLNSVALVFERTIPNDVASVLQEVNSTTVPPTDVASVLPGDNGATRRNTQIHNTAHTKLHKQ